MNKKVTFIETLKKETISVFFVLMIIAFLWTLGTFITDLLTVKSYIGLMKDNSIAIVISVLIFQSLIILVMRQYLLKQMDRYNGIYKDGFWR